LLYNNDLDVK